MKKWAYYADKISTDINSIGQKGGRIKGSFNANIAYEQDAVDILKNPKIILTSSVSLEAVGFDIEIIKYKLLAEAYSLLSNYSTSTREAMNEMSAIEFQQKDNNIT